MSPFYRDVLQQEYSKWLSRISDGNMTALTASEAEQCLTSLLDLICFDLVHNRIHQAFEKLKSSEADQVLTVVVGTMERLSSEATTESKVSASFLAQPLSLFYELFGTMAHLRCDLDTAIDYYRKAMNTFKENYDATMKYALLMHDLGDVIEVIAYSGNF
jgi:hypothetical protein